MREPEELNMENQHRKITGYRELTQEEIDTMNMVKALGEEMASLIQHIETVNGVDRRWVAIGRTDLQTGLMALTRAVARPESF